MLLYLLFTSNEYVYLFEAYKLEKQVYFNLYFSTKCSAFELTSKLVNDDFYGFLLLSWLQASKLFFVLKSWTLFVLAYFRSLVDIGSK